MDVLPIELQTEILLRLPATTLVTTARHVCRLWRWIISDSIFVKEQLIRSIDDEDNNVLLFHRDRWNHNKGLLMYSSERDFTLIGPKGKLPESQKFYLPTTFACKGLVLYVYYKHEIVEFFLCNPILNQCISLTPRASPPTVVWNRIEGCVCPIGSGSNCVCEFRSDLLMERKSYWGCGFGFDPITNQYKVVVISTTKNSPTSEVYCCAVDVVSCKKTISSWKKLGSFNHMIESSEGVFVNGKLHWLLSETNVDNTDDLIFFVDLNTEKLNLLSRRKNQPADMEYKHLGVLGGTKLCMYVGDYTGESSLYVMEDDYRDVGFWMECCHFNNLTFNHENFGFLKKNCFVFNNVYDRYYVVDMKNKEIAYSVKYPGTSRKRISLVSTFVPCLVSLVEDNHRRRRMEQSLVIDSKPCLTI